MTDIDLNLLVALDALLAERSVTRAARRLGLSVSATSRTLARLREATGDQLLLQAGRALVPTPHAQELALRVPDLARAARAALAPADDRFDSATLARSFTIRAGEGFIELLAPALLARLQAAAPRVQLRFVPKTDWDPAPLRDGAIDLEIGTVRTAAPELRTRTLFRDRYVLACRRDHPILAYKKVTLRRYAAFDHVLVSRAGERDAAIDAALKAHGLARRVRVVVPAYTAALQLLRRSDLLAVVPHSCLGNRLLPEHAGDLGLRHAAPPVALAPFNVASVWHPRLDQDPAQRWLRNEVLQVALAAYPPAPAPA